MSVARASAAVLALALAGCSGPSDKPPTQATLKANQAAAAKPAVAAMDGTVKAPSGIVAAGAGNVLSHNGGAIVAAGAGNVLSHNGAAYRLQGLAQAPLAGAQVWAAGPDGSPLDGVEPATTDASGRYRLQGVPATGDYTVVVVVKDAQGRLGTLRTLTRAGATADVSAGTTCVSESMLSRLKGQVTGFDLAAFKAAVVTFEASMTEADLPDWSDRGAIAGVVEKVKQRDPAVGVAMDVMVAGLQRLEDKIDDLTNLIKATPTPAPTATPAPSATPGPGPTATPAPTRQVQDVVLRLGLREASGAETAVALTYARSLPEAVEPSPETMTTPGGAAFRLATATLPERFKLYVAPGTGAPARTEANLVGEVLVTDLGAAGASFTPRAGTAYTVSGARLVPYFDTIAAYTYEARLVWKGKAGGQPTKPMKFRFKADGNGSWSEKNAQSLEKELTFGDTLKWALGPVELPARFRATADRDGDGKFEDDEDFGYVQLKRSNTDDAIGATFNREPSGGDIDFD